MKLKSLLISLVLVTTATVTLADPASFVVGAILGAVVTQPRQVYVHPGYIVSQAPQVIYQQVPVVIDQSQVPYFDPNLHGYCANYRDEVYARCVDNIRRIKLEQAYQQGLHGY